MTHISVLYMKYWRNIHISIVIVLTGILVYNPPVVNSYISQGIVGSLYFPFFKLKTVVSDLSVVNEENRRLQEALMETSMKINLLEEIERENARLRGILGFDPPAAHEMVPARVISVFGEPIPISATINRGESDSVLMRQAIINEQGLVGRISAVSHDFASVQLLTDPTNRVAARVGNSREMGIARYVTGEGMILDNVPIQATVEPGDQIISSGLGGVYPAGLMIGTVTSVIRPADEPFCRISLTPASNFNSLEELFILRPVSL